MSNGFVKYELQYITVKLFSLFWNSSYDLFYVRLMLIWLENHKLIRSTFSYLQESVACHLHDTWKVFFHKLEKFFYYGFQKGPIVS